MGIISQIGHLCKYLSVWTYQAQNYLSLDIYNISYLYICLGDSFRRKLKHPTKKLSPRLIPCHCEGAKRAKQSSMKALRV